MKRHVFIAVSLGFGGGSVRVKVISLEMMTRI